MVQLDTSKGKATRKEIHSSWGNTFEFGKCFYNNLKLRALNVFNLKP